MLTDSSAISDQRVLRVKMFRLFFVFFVLTQTAELLELVIVKMVGKTSGKNLPLFSTSVIPEKVTSSMFGFF